MTWSNAIKHWNLNSSQHNLKHYKFQLNLRNRVFSNTFCNRFLNLVQILSNQSPQNQFAGHSHHITFRAYPQAPLTFYQLSKAHMSYPRSIAWSRSERKYLFSNLCSCHGLLSLDMNMCELVKNESRNFRNNLIFIIAAKSSMSFPNQTEQASQSNLATRLIT